MLRCGRGPVLITTDTLVEDVHFRRRWLTPAALGERLFGANASDVAAMGGVPTFAVLAVEAPRSTSVADLDALVLGFARAARRAGAHLVGGNVTSGRRLAVTATLLGEARGQIVRRSGARAGDVVVVTGTLGGAGFAVRRLRAGRPARLAPPPLRLRAAQVLARVAHAMIDVSDGVVQDLGHLCRASGVAAELDLPRLPVALRCRRALGSRAARFAATAGEDYELLAAVPPSALRYLARQRMGCRVTPIGRVVVGRPEVRLLDRAGRRVRVGRAGYDHFR